MAESTAALSYDDLMRVVSERAGYGFFATQGEGLTADQETEILTYVDEGYRTFLLAHEWSFTRPLTTSVLFATTDATTTMTVSGAGNTTITASAATFFPTMIGHTIVSTNASYVISAYTSSTVVTVTTDASADNGLAFQITANGSYRLPDDFGGLIGEVFYQQGDGRWIPIAQLGVAELVELLQITEGTGRPTSCAVDPQPLSTSETIGQRHDLLAWRIPDADYTIRYRYQVLPDKLVTTAYPYGGALHAETIKYACLSAMERTKFVTVNGPYDQQFQKLLVQSIKRDNRGARANSLGFMVNARRTRLGSRGTYFLPFPNSITVEGQSFP